MEVGKEVGVEYEDSRIDDQNQKRGMRSLA